MQNNNNIKMKNEKQREIILKEALAINKLEYKNYGDCFSFIHYGKPSLEEVLTNELKKANIKHNRRVLLASRLKEYNIELDESLKSCYNYVNNIGCNVIDEVIKAIEIEHFLKYKTNYDKLCKIYNQEIAKEKAIVEYFNRDKVKEKVPVNNKIRLSFE